MRTPFRGFLPNQNFRHGSGTPVVAECDGDYTYEKRGALLWQLPMIDAKNKTGSIEFSCGGNPDDFFPVQVAFFSKKSYSGIEVCNYELHCHSVIGSNIKLVSLNPSKPMFYCRILLQIGITEIPLQ